MNKLSQKDLEKTVLRGRLEIGAKWLRNGHLQIKIGQFCLKTGQKGNANYILFQLFAG